LPLTKPSATLRVAANPSIPAAKSIPPHREAGASPAPGQAAPEKTYSDEEILAAVKEPAPTARKSGAAKPLPPWAEKKRGAAEPVTKGKASRSTPKHQTRLWMNLGAAQQIQPIDIVNAIAGETGLPGKVVGTVDVREKHLFVDVDSEKANAIVAKLNRTQIKGHKVKVKAA
jgi:ATP-dependent RNA helicase DeaD